jgi:hypothetical protein
MYAKRLACTCVLCAASLGSTNEYQVNMRTAGNQANPAIVGQRDGGFAVVWSSYFSSGGRSNEIIARRFEANGHPAGAEFQVNATSAGNQTEPAVASCGPGLLFVAWQGPGDDGDEDIFARVFDPNDEPVTSDFAVTSEAPGRQLYPSVAGCDEGTFVVVWESRRPGETTSIRGRSYDAQGAALGEAFAVAHSTRDSRYPDVAMDGMGRFAAVWMEDRSSNRIFARVFDGKGTALAGPLAVSTADIASVTRPSVAMSWDGAFVVAWDGDPRLAGLDDVHARRFNANGTAQSDAFVVNAQTEGRQQLPRVAIEESGAFIVAWQQTHDDPNLATDIFARRFDSAGRSQAGESKLNGYVAGRQQDVGIVLSQHGTAAIVWESEDQDGSGYGVFACVEAVADLNADGLVDFQDFGMLGRSWRGWRSEFPEDGVVKARELEVFCQYWLR